MPQLQINTKKMIDGERWEGEVTILPGSRILSVIMNFPCRLIIYKDAGVRRNDQTRQLSQTPPDGALAQIVSDYLMTKLKPGIDLNGRPYLWPSQLPIALRCYGALPVAVEARSGNRKHRINFEIVLEIER